MKFLLFTGLLVSAICGYGHAEAQGTPKPCTICKLVVNIIQEQIEIANISLDAAEKIAEQICKVLPEESEKDMCNKIVGDIKIIADMIMKKMDVSKICSTLGFCDSVSDLYHTLLKESKPSPKEADGCQICTMVVKIVSHVLKETSLTVEQVTKMIKGICAPFSQSASECSKIVDQVDLLVQGIIKGLEPGDICKQLGVCPSKSLQSQEPVKKFSPCKTCTLVVTLIDEILQTVNATTADVVAMVKGICSMFPESSAECSKITDQVEKIIQLILSGLSPEDICKKIGVCSTIPISLTSVKTLPYDSKICDDCKLVVGVLKKVVKNINDSLPFVVGSIKAICSMAEVPEAECSMVISMVEEILKMIEDEMDVGDICVKIGLCPKNSLHAPLAVLKDRSNLQDCPMCRYMVQVVKMGVAMKVPKETMKGSITFVCGLFKQQHEFVQCTKFSDNLDAILSMLEAGKSSEQICEWLGKCTNQEISETVLRFDSFQSNGSCETCKTIVATIANLVKEFGANLKDLEESVDEICSLLGDKEDECKKIAGEVFESIGTVLDLIEKDLDPEAICASIAHVCP